MVNSRKGPTILQKNHKRYFSGEYFFCDISVRSHSEGENTEQFLWDEKAFQGQWSWSERKRLQVDQPSVPHLDFLITDDDGFLSRDALFRILVTMLGCPMNPLQFRRLTERLGLGDRQIINHIDFFSALRGHSAGEHPRWMDPIQRQQMDRACLSAGHVHALLVEKARQR